jgi:hypothetical protein
MEACPGRRVCAMVMGHPVGSLPGHPHHREPFASLRLRTDAAKRCRKVENATVLLWKLLLVAQKSFRKLDAAEHLRDVLVGRTYEDGNLVMLPQGTRRTA